jgi:hypothetical protein
MDSLKETYRYEVYNPRGELKFKIPSTAFLLCVYKNDKIQTPGEDYYICNNYVYFPKFVYPRINFLDKICYAIGMTPALSPTIIDIEIMADNIL